MTAKTKKKPEPMTQAERVRASEARAIERGARRIPCGMLSPEAAEALDALQGNGYGGSAGEVIRRALVDAAKRKRRR